MQVPPIFYLPIAITVINNNTNVFLAINTRSYTARDTTALCITRTIIPHL